MNRGGPTLNPPLVTNTWFVGANEIRVSIDCCEMSFRLPTTVAAVAGCRLKVASRSNIAAQMDVLSLCGFIGMFLSVCRLNKKNCWRWVEFGKGKGFFWLIFYFTFFRHFLFSSVF